MKNFNKNIIAVAMFSASAVVNADPIFYDVGAAAPSTVVPPNGDADTLTSVFNQLQFYAQTTTVQYDTVPGNAGPLGGPGAAGLGDRFIDSGNLNVTSLISASTPDDEGLNTLGGYELTATWTGLNGVITSNLTLTGGLYTQTLAYDTAGNSIWDFYIDVPPNHDFDGTVGVAGDTGFADGTKVLSVEIVGGVGTNTTDASGTFLEGSSTLLGKVTYALDNFWYFDNGNGIANTVSDTDFNSLLGSYFTILAHIDQNTDEVVVDRTGAGTAGPVGYGSELFKVDSDHDGSVDFTTVPEPTSILLMGMGLIGLARRVHRSLI